MAGELTWCDKCPDDADERELCRKVGCFCREAGAAAEREALRQEIKNVICGYGDSCCINTLKPCNYESEADEIVAIIDRHTAKALETALRERDGALEPSDS